VKRRGKRKGGGKGREREGKLTRNGNFLFQALHFATLYLVSSREPAGVYSYSLSEDLAE